jgi:hypothetical protein
MFQKEEEAKEAARVKLFVIVLLVVTAIILIIRGCAFAYSKALQENEYLKGAFSKYTVANGKNVGKLRAINHEYEFVSKELGVPVELLNAVQIHENLGTGIKDHDPREWQE